MLVVVILGIVVLQGELHVRSLTPFRVIDSLITYRLDKFEHIMVMTIEDMGKRCTECLDSALGRMCLLQSLRFLVDLAFNALDLIGRDKLSHSPWEL